MFSWIFIVLAHWNNSPGVDMRPHSDTLSWFRDTLIKKYIFDIFVDTLSLYIFTIWKSIVYNLFCRDGIYFDQILVSEYKLISTKIYDKREDFNFKIINFPNMCSNIPASPAYGVYISQLIRYARPSSNYSDFLKRKFPAVTITVFITILQQNR
jgi:hypothetical protein